MEIVPVLRKITMPVAELIFLNLNRLKIDGYVGNS
jgi:hypothetical protein